MWPKVQHGANGHAKYWICSCFRQLGHLGHVKWSWLALCCDIWSSLASTGWVTVLGEEVESPAGRVHRHPEPSCWWEPVQSVAHNRYSATAFPEPGTRRTASAEVTNENRHIGGWTVLRLPPYACSPYAAMWV